MTVVGEMQDEVGDKSLAIVTFQTLAVLIAECLLSIVLFAFVKLQVFQ